MNILYRTKTYLAGNLENNNDKDARAWRSYVKKEFGHRNIISLDPTQKNFVSQNFPEESDEFRGDQDNLLHAGKYWEVHNNMKPVVRQDLAMVDKVDFLFVVIDPTRPTAGTIDEIGHANLSRKPIFLVIEGGIPKIPKWLAGKIPPTYWHGDIESAMDHVSRIDEGEEELDPKYWRLLISDLR
jgi:nucleoside 2-deoxyribosyltransferase